MSNVHIGILTITIKITVPNNCSFRYLIIATVSLYLVLKLSELNIIL